ncbi:hypothetical protein [Streptomyces hesseae]|uniref:Uncharacterized protein n=1 Tax=Streptomyces hesseae TaxID=3075519 RepID=A0ABU2SKB5_9ACTN|nr:hypothetical protein [Streptomyces sp. DSM 40473]MDT0449424.1 hypothetical protein [Streptomyces sp. DSM 40473]
MMPSRTARLSALAVAVPLLVLGTPAAASAQCSEPNYRGSRTFPGGSCPEQVADTASGVVWAVLVLAAALWVALALSRSRATTDADLALVDATFSHAATAEATSAEAAPSAPRKDP